MRADTYATTERAAFHFAGIGSQLTLGVPRFKELIDLAKQMRTPSMQIFLRPPFCSSRRFAEDLAASIIQTRLSDVVTMCDFVDDAAARSGDMVSVDVDMVLRPVPLEYSTSYIRMTLRRELMTSRMITPADICSHLSIAYADNMHFSCSDTNELEWFIQMRVRIKGASLPEKLLLDRLAECVIHETHICGMKKITNAYVRSISEPIAPGCREDRYIIETNGICLSHVALCDAIDMRRLRLNDIDEVYNAFGAEATVSILFEQLETTISFDGTYVEPRHILQSESRATSNLT